MGAEPAQHGTVRRGPGGMTHAGPAHRSGMRPPGLPLTNKPEDPP
jgi:hypothetical protein